MTRPLRTLCGAILFLCFATFGYSATLTVTNNSDISDGTCDANCSLREAILAANSAPEDDTIVFDEAVFATPQTIVMTGSEFALSNSGSITISGPGATLLTIDGNNATRVMIVSPGTTAFIDGVTITRGNGVSPTNSGRGGGLYNLGGNLVLTNSIITGNNAANGGGINNVANGTVLANLTIRNCIISNNTSTGTGGGLQNFSTSTILIENTTFIGNVSNGTSGGGGMGVNGFVTISNSTFVGNSATNGPGGGLQSNGPLFVLNNVTVTGNSALTRGGGYYRSSSNANNFLRNTIIAGNTGAAEAPDVTQATNGTISSLGNNVIGVVGTSVGWVKSDITGVDAKLSPVGNYGGFGMTVIPMSDSPAINAGQNCVIDLSCSSNNPTNAITADQRGAERSDATVDIGAYEINSSYVATLPPGNVGDAYSQIISPNAGAFTFGITSGSIPAGLNLVTSLYQRVQDDGTPTGVVTIAGTPTQAGLYLFGMSITNGASSAAVNYTMGIEGSLENVSVSGQVENGFGAGISDSIVFISNGTTFSESRRTNSFGNFRFDSVPSGSYVISVFRKGYTFDPVQIDITDNVEGLEITATSGD